MRVFQLLKDLGYGDAISSDALALDRLMKEHGMESAIYAKYFKDRRLPQTIRKADLLPGDLREDDLVLYHLSIGTEMSEWFGGLPCKKGFIYHNITPPEYFADYHPHIAEETRYGRSTLQTLAGRVDFAFADSDFNAQELKKLNYRNVSVLPILLDFESYRQQPDEKTLQRYSDGKKNILFVGRLAPNKRQEDVLLAFDYYQKNLNPDCRLLLVGSDRVTRYADALRALAERLGTKDVIFTGHTSFEEMLACYHAADLFLCMSEHEGFCVPLLECMALDVPILAYNSTAIPGTLGDSGIIFNEKRFDFVAAAMKAILSDKGLQQKICAFQKKRLQHFSHEKIEAAFWKQLLPYLSMR